MYTYEASTNSNVRTAIYTFNFKINFIFMWRLDLRNIEKTLILQVGII